MLQRAGLASLLVVDKARGVGGRCATRRVQEQPVDHGVIFYHGANPEFIGALVSVEDATVLPGWPRQVLGSGTPCQPEAFHAYEKRLAFAEGVSTFPKHLARGLKLQLNTSIVALEATGGHFRLRAQDGACFTARTVVVALPSEQARGLLETLPERFPELDTARTLLGMIASEPCLTLLAGYPMSIPQPPWDVYYPEESKTILLVSHDSSKRKKKRFHTLVYQCRSRWSRQRMNQDTSVWSQEILDEATHLLGSWANEPQWVQAHRWRYARVEQAAALTSPVLVPFPEGQQLGLAGEAFAPCGGVEAAWLSGRRLAERILGEKQQ
jgi:predicted NAD/FAD-dependent oxidoreductase